MTEPTLKFLMCPDKGTGHRMAYWQWGGDDAARTIVCVHGLSRQGRDFDVLARALLAHASGSVRVICPDIAGRGQSDWLPEPMHYQIPTYVGDVLFLLSNLKVSEVDWVGTSMGGLIGMLSSVHAASVGVTIRKLVLNDVGPVIQREALARIGTYLGKSVQFSSLQEAADAMWSISSSFGPHTSQQWLDLCRHMVRPVEAAPGLWKMHYDPAIAVPFHAITDADAQQGQELLWKTYDAITSDTLLLRGTDSDLLTRETAQEMSIRGPKARVVEFAGVGHAPTLVADDQVRVVIQFLTGSSE